MEYLVGRTWLTINLQIKFLKRKIDVYAMNEMKRDFTHISDIVDGIMASLKYPDLKNHLNYLI